MFGKSGFIFLVFFFVLNMGRMLAQPEELPSYSYFSQILPFSETLNNPSEILKAILPKAPKELVLRETDASEKTNRRKFLLYFKDFHSLIRTLVNALFN